jgi:hypothetical protein
MAVSPGQQTTEETKSESLWAVFNVIVLSCHFKRNVKVIVSMIIFLVAYAYHTRKYELSVPWVLFFPRKMDGFI